MTNVRIIHVDWYSQRPPRFHGGPQLAYQDDHLSNMVVFDNAPELPNYHLIVEMKTDDAGPVVTLPPILLEGPYWVIPNYYTQICQQITYQVCCKTENGDYEHHSAKFKGTILPVLKHNGEPIDLSPMFDPYMDILDKRVHDLIVAAGDVQIDSELKSNSVNPVQNRVIKAAIDEIGEDVSDIDGRVEHLEEGGLNIKDEVIEADINTWLDEHPEATTTVEDGAITEAKLASALKLKISNAYVTPEMFGAIGDGVTDDTQAWENAISSGKCIYASGTYLVSRTLSLNNDVYVDGLIYNDESEVAILISKKSQRTYKICVATHSQNNGELTGIKVEDSNNCCFRFYVRNFFNSVVYVGNTTGCCYNNTDFLYLQNAKNFITLTSINNGWCNQNYFANIRTIGETNTLFKGADYGIVVIGDNTHDINGNAFYNACVENTYCGATFTKARDNSIFSIRTEGCTYAAIFNEKAIYNDVQVSYGITNCIDNNIQNFVYGLPLKVAVKKLIATTGALAGRVVSNASYASAVGLYRKLGSGTFSRYVAKFTASEYGLKTIGNTQAIVGFLINVKENKRLMLECAVSNKYRTFVVPFDANGVFVSDAVIRTTFSKYAYTNSSLYGQLYTSQSDAPATTHRNIMKVFTPEVESVFFGIMINVKDAVISYMSVYGDETNYEMASNPTPALNSIPTSEGFYIGQEVYSTSGAVKWIWDGTQWAENNIVLTT